MKPARSGMPARRKEHAIASSTCSMNESPSTPMTGGLVLPEAKKLSTSLIVVADGGASRSSASRSYGVGRTSVPLKCRAGVGAQ
eukprot:4501808-Prymnesium_polylepis.2